MRVLIANRGEVAVRLVRAVASLGWESLVVHGQGDEGLAVRLADRAIPLAGRGLAPLNDIEAVVEAARSAGADLVHPGWGFLAERPEAASAVEAAGMVWVGPSADTLTRLGDKAAARSLAGELGLPVLAGAEVSSADEAVERAAELGLPLLFKAVAGGGGRGMRVIDEPGRVAAAFGEASAEARAAFGDGRVYLERLMPRARHVEVQLIGDGSEVRHLGERDCTVQRRHQKLIELAPATSVPLSVREQLWAHALTLGRAVGLRSLATVEFLVDADDPDRIAFIEVNPRLQVEHTVTEEVLDLDLVAAQLRLAGGESLGQLDLPSWPPPEATVAVQARINAERTGPDGTPGATAGTVSGLELPGGRGVRVDSQLATGLAIDPAFDPMVAKLIVRSRSGRAGALAGLGRALDELVVEGIDTNIDLLSALVAEPALVRGEVTTDFYDAWVAELVAEMSEVLAPHPSPEVGDPGSGGVLVRASQTGTVVDTLVAAGDEVGEHQELMILEALKMHHPVLAPSAATVEAVLVGVGDTVRAGDPVLILMPREASGEAGAARAEIDPDHIRPDLAEVIERHRIGLDAARPEAMARRHERGHRSARENIEDLIDPGSLIEYGPLTIAAQRKRRELDDLITRTPADGLVGGLASVNADLVGRERSSTVVVSYDYTVLAGTQGTMNHLKKDRLFELAEELSAPVVLFAEGGGGRPGDTDQLGVTGLDCLAFRLFAELSGRVPLVGIANGRCFAGNAALLGCCDVVIATEGTSLGMGGPAMIEGGGLGRVEPDEVGPTSVQYPNGNIDVLVADEAEAVSVARRYLSYFQGPVADWEAPDQRLLRHVVPEDRLRVYDVRAVLDLLFDVDSVLELRAAYGPGMITALARLEGRPVGVIANDPRHLSGAIAGPEADTAARFLQLCDAFGLPVISLCDTPGFMVGPEAERDSLVRRCARMFVVGASLSVPLITVVLRKCYGLGAQAMAGGTLSAPLATVSWPTGEFGGMGLEGAVRLGYRKELEAIDDPEERAATERRMIDRMYEIGKALNVATYLEIDDVIDPADTRRWLTGLLAASPTPPAGDRPRRPCVDPW